MEGLKRKGIAETTSYANPNTSSSNSAPGEPPREQAADLVKVRCRELAAAEVERIERDSDCARLDTFQRRIDKAFQWQAKRLDSILTAYGGDNTKIANYCTSRKQMIFDSVADAGGDHRLAAVCQVEDVAGHIYHTLFEGNGKP